MSEELSAEVENEDQPAVGVGEEVTVDSVEPVSEEPAVEGDDDAGESDGVNPNREAAKYRIQAREAQAEAESLRSQVAELQAAVVRLMVTDRLVNPDDFGQFVDLDRVRGEDGRIDHGKLASEVEQLLQERPYLAVKHPLPGGRPRMPKTRPALGGRAGEAGKDALGEAFGDSDASWGELLHKQGGLTGAAKPKQGVHRLRLGESDS